MKDILKSKKAFSLKSLGKKLLIGLGIVGMSLSLVACGGEKEPPIIPDPPIVVPNPPTPVPEPDVKDVADLVANYPTQLKSFLENEMINDMVYLPTEKEYKDLEIVYASWYLGRSSAPNLNYVALAFTVKLDDTKREYYVTETNLENAPIDLDLIAKYDETSSSNDFFPDGIGVSQVDSLTVSYDAKEKQNDSEFLNKLYGSGALREDVLTKDYTPETFQVEEKINSVEELYTKYPSETQNFIDRVYASYLVENNIDINDVTFAQLSFKDKNSTTLDDLNLVISYKLSEKGKEILVNSTLKLKDIFDFEYISKIDGMEGKPFSYYTEQDKLASTIDVRSQYFRQDVVDALVKLSGAKVDDNTKVALIQKDKTLGVVIANQTGLTQYAVTLNSVASDSEILAQLKNGNYQVFFNETFDYAKTYTEQAPVEEKYELSVEDIIKLHGDKVNENLEAQYQSVLKSAFGRAYGTSRFEVQSYQWDLGEVVDGKVQNLKITLNYYDNNASTNTLRVYDVKLNEAIDANTLLNASAMANVKTTNTTAYTYTYDATKQNDMNEVLSKVAELELNGFEYKNALYTRTGGSVEFGGASGYTISYLGENGIKEITVIIKDASTSSGLLANINSGNYKVAEIKEVEFSNNQLAEQNIVQENTNELE